VTASERLAAAPEIPTVDEAGLPGFHVQVWHAIWVPRATPAAIIERLNAAIREALASASVQKRFADLGQDIPLTEMQSVSALAAFQKAEVERWAPLLKAANLKTD
jgi:tripartite-type tricarboxylate transporter receptor subunit TctC